MSGSHEPARGKSQPWFHGPASVTVVADASRTRRGSWPLAILGLAPLLAALGSCGSMTHELWNDGLPKKHWQLMVDELDATCVGLECDAPASGASAATLTARGADEIVAAAGPGNGGRPQLELRLAAAESSLASAWLGVFGGTAPAGPRTLVLRADRERAAAASAILAGAAQVAGARVVIVKTRTASGTDEPHAWLELWGLLGTSEVARWSPRSPGGTADAAAAAGASSPAPTDCPAVASCVAALPWATWFDPHGDQTLESRLLAVCTPDGVACDRAAEVERAVAESDGATLRQSWLRIATRTAHETRELLVRADVLRVTSLADCTPTADGLAWHCKTRWTTTLEPKAGAAPAEGSLPLAGVQLSFQHRELIRGQGIGTFPKVLLTPLTAVADVATLFVAMGVWQAVFHDDREWEWDDSSHRFAPGRSGSK